MKKIFSLIACTAVAALGLSSCDLNPPAASITVPLGEQAVSMPISYVAPAPTGMPQMTVVGTSSFGGSCEVNINDEMFADLSQYLNDAITLLASGVNVKITTTETIGTVNTFNCTATATGYSDSYTLPAPVDLKTSAYSDTELSAFVQGVFTQVQAGKTVTISVSGTTSGVSTAGASIGDLDFTSTIKAKIQVSK